MITGETSVVSNRTSYINLKMHSNVIDSGRESLKSTVYAYFIIKSG